MASQRKLFPVHFWEYQMCFYKSVLIFLHFSSLIAENQERRQDNINAN